MSSLRSPARNVREIEPWPGRQAKLDDAHSVYRPRHLIRNTRDNFPDVTAASPSPPFSVLEAARQLAPMVRHNADQIDAARELPKPVFHALADAGLYLMCVPRAVGGLEVDFPTYVQAIEEIGKADASTAWTISQNANFSTYSARMARDAAREIWVDTPRSAVSNSPGPTAQ